MTFTDQSPGPRDLGQGCEAALDLWLAGQRLAPISQMWKQRPWGRADSLRLQREAIPAAESGQSPCCEPLSALRVGCVQGEMAGILCSVSGYSQVFVAEPSFRYMQLGERGIGQTWTPLPPALLPLSPFIKSLLSKPQFSPLDNGFNDRTC